MNVYLEFDDRNNDIKRYQCIPHAVDNILDGTFIALKIFIQIDLMLFNEKQSLKKSNLKLLSCFQATQKYLGIYWRG